METETNQNQNQQQQQFQEAPQYYQQQYAPVDNLNTFSILHLVKGILTLFFSLFFLFYAFMGGFFRTIFENEAHLHNNPEMPFNPGNIFIIIGVIGFIITVVMGILTLLTAKYIKARRNYTFIFVMSIINCLSVPLGTLLGIFTIIEINKPHIKAQFDKKEPIPEQF